MTHAGLFSGIGGFSLAAQWMGWTNVFEVELDAWCRQVLHKNFPHSQLKLLATPTARDWKSGKASEATHARNSRPLSEQLGGSLNPRFVCAMMGFPIGWTEI